MTEPDSAYGPRMLYNMTFIYILGNCKAVVGGPFLGKKGFSRTSADLEGGGGGGAGGPDPLENQKLYGFL